MSSVKITLDGGRVVVGKVLVVDPVTSTLVVQGDQGYSLVNPNTIVHIDGTLDDIVVPNVSEYGLNVNKFEKQEMQAQLEAEKALALVNTSVSSEVQSLFEKIARIYPCKWEGVNMIILDDIVIEPPYDKVVVRPNAVAKMDIGLVSKTLSGERKKLNMEK